MNGDEVSDALDSTMRALTNAERRRVIRSVATATVDDEWVPVDDALVRAATDGRTHDHASSTTRDAERANGGQLEANGGEPETDGGETEPDGGVSEPSGGVTEASGGGRDERAATHERRRVQIELEHRHLPMLAAEGFVDWDRSNHRVRRGPNFGRVEGVITALEANGSQFPSAFD